VRSIIPVLGEDSETEVRRNGYDKPDLADDVCKLGQTLVSTLCGVRDTSTRRASRRVPHLRW